MTLDGQAVPYFRVNHAFKGVAIPAAGRHELTFAYWPQYLTPSLWLAATGALIAMILAGLVFFRKQPDHVQLL